MTMSRTTIPAIALMAAIAVCSCNHSRESSAYTGIDPHGWPYGSTIELQLATDTLVHEWTPELNIEFNDKCPCRILPLELTTARGTDTLMIELADTTGHRHGVVTAGTCRLNMALHKITARDTVTFTLRNILRADTLRGIERVGIFMTRE